ncbi:MAG: ornithine carbamoyltransferase [Candidatus Omnitrophica bacterium]|nr:ornithine carbamoyltransferase [Candidatus Omnitrophota bacterium]
MDKDFISIKNLTEKDIEEIFLLTDRLKKDPFRFKNILSGKTIVLIFQKPSNRTRVSFEVAIFQLGGNSIYLGKEEIKLGVRESIKDVAKTLSRYVEGIVLRTFSHNTILEMAKYAAIPVINGLSDFSHPCQVLADLYTIREKFKRLKGIKLAYVGDGNNVCHSLLYGCPKVGIDISIATPLDYTPDKTVVKDALLLSKKKDSSVKLFNIASEAVENADIIYTDVWTSMGKEKEAKIRKKIFKKFQVNSKLLKLSKKNCLVMHCLPAHRGEEITDEVIDGPNSIVFDQAENRLHVQKAILIKLLKPNFKII